MAKPEASESKLGAPDLGELPPDYINDDVLIEAEQGPATFFASCTTLLSSMFRLVVPNRWPKP